MTMESSHSCILATFDKTFEKFSVMFNQSRFESSSLLKNQIYGPLLVNVENLTLSLTRFMTIIFTFVQFPHLCYSMA